MRTIIYTNTNPADHIGIATLGRAYPMPPTRPVPPGHVPVDPIAHILERHATAHKAHGATDPLQALAHQLAAGGAFVNQAAAARRVNNYLNRRVHTISVQKADAILCALGQPDLWHTDPQLARYYEPGDA